MSLLVSIPRISTAYLDKLIETRRLVISVCGDKIVVQEESKELNRIGGMPFRIQVETDTIYDVTCGHPVKVFGIPTLNSKQGSHIHSILLTKAKVTIITKDEADLSYNHSVDTYFTQNILNYLRCDTREELNTILRKHVNEEGFDLVVKKNRKS